MNRAMLTRHLEQAERRLAESEAHVKLHLDHLHSAKERGWAVDQQRRTLDLAIDLRLLHGKHVARLRAELSAAPDEAEHDAGPAAESGGV